MPETTEIKTPSEFLRLLEVSGILRNDQLQVARSMVRETPTSKMLARRLVAKGILTRWQAGQLLVGWTKLRLGNYKLCRQIGRGGFGRVFLAEHIQLKREVAIKTLSRRYTQRKEIVDQFLDEARKAAALDHRNLVHVLDIDSAADQYYMVMEYVVGQDLQRLVTLDGPPSPSQVALYLYQAADGLDCAHQAGIVHHDICPANLMLDNKRGIKVLGLGVGSLKGSSDASPNPQDDEPQELLGDFRAPEQFPGDTSDDARCDIYSLGATAVYLLTGQPPGGVGAASGDEPIDAAQAGEIAWQLEGLPATLVAIIQKMLAVEPEQRYATAHDAGAALQAWLEEHAEQPAEVQPPAVREASKALPPQLSGNFTVDAHGADPSSELSGKSDKLESAARLPHLRGRTIAVVALASMLIAVAVYVLWPDRATTVAAGDRSVPKTEDATAKSAPDLEPRRGKSKSKVLRKTTLPTAGAGHEQSELTEEPTTTDVPSDKTGEDPPGSKTPEKNVPDPSKVDGANPDAPKKVPSDPRKSDAPEAKKPPRIKPFIADNPLKDMPGTIDLPNLSRADAADHPLYLDVGPMAESLARDIEVSLLGGEHACKAAQFVLEAADGGVTPSWNILLQDGGSTEETAIADLKVASGQLRFSWDATASTHVLSPGLCNCVLRFTAGKHVHDMRLRTAKPIKPLMVNLHRPSISQRWPVQAAPDPRHIRFEITQLEEPFPSVYNLKPVQPILADDEEVLVQIGSEDLDDHVVFLKLATQMRTSFRLECRAFFRITPQLDPIPVQQKNIVEAVTFVKNKQNQDNVQAQRAGATLNQLRRDPRRKKAAEKELKLREKELAVTSEAYGRMEALLKIREAMTEGAAIHFRLYYLADDCEVDLVRTTSE